MLWFTVFICRTMVIDFTDLHFHVIFAVNVFAMKFNHFDLYVDGTLLRHILF